MKIEKEVVLKHFRGYCLAVVDDEDGIFCELDLGGGRIRFYNFTKNTGNFIFMQQDGKIDFDKSTSSFWTFAKNDLFNSNVFTRHDSCCILKAINSLFITFILEKEGGSN